MKARKILSAIIAIAIIATLTVSVSAADGVTVDDSGTISVYDGVSIDTSWYNTTDTEFTINSAAAFAGFAAIVNGTVDGIEVDNFKGKTIKLATDIDLNNCEWTPIGARKSSSEDRTIECVFDGQNHTIYNLKVTREATNEVMQKRLGLFGKSTSGKFVAKNFTIENVSLYGAGSAAAVLADGYSASKVVIDNVTVKGDIKIEVSQSLASGICGQAYGPVITNCKVIGNDGSYIKAGTYEAAGILGWGGEKSGANNTVVENCTVENITVSSPAYVSSVVAVAQYAASIKNNSSKNVKIDVLEGYENNEYYYGTIIGSVSAGSGGTSDVHSLPIYISGNSAENTAVSLNGVAIENPVLNGAHWDGTSYVSAKIGDAYYESLQTAIDAAANGAEIDIIDNFSLTAQDANAALKPAYNRESYAGLIIPDDKAITIDLNGKIISYVDEYGDCDNLMVINLGNLTISDSVGGGKITYKPVAGSSTYSKFYSTIFNCGTLTVNGGTIENTAEAETDVTNAVDNHSRLSHEYDNDCILTVNGGQLTGAYYYAIRQYTHYFEGVKNRVTINAGTIEGGIYMQHGDSWYYADPSKNRLNVDGYLTINGGNFIATSTDNFNTIKSRLANPDNNAWGLEINGGAFNDASIQLLVQRGVYYTNGVSGATTPAEATGTRNAEWLEKNGGFITGGTFSNIGSADDVTTNLASFLADGYALVKNSDGTYGVEEKKEDVIDPAFGTTLGVARIGANEEDYELVVLGAIDSLDYKDVGFEITFNDKVHELKTKTVYTKITSTDAETNEVKDYTSKELNGAENGYVFGQMLGFALEDISKQFTCRLFAINLNNEYVFGKTWTIPVSE